MANINIWDSQDSKSGKRSSVALVRDVREARRMLSVGSRQVLLILSPLLTMMIVWGAFEAHRGYQIHKSLVVFPAIYFLVLGIGGFAYLLSSRALFMVDSVVSGNVVSSRILLFSRLIRYEDIGRISLTVDRRSLLILRIASGTGDSITIVGLGREKCRQVLILLQQKVEAKSFNQEALRLLEE